MRPGANNVPMSYAGPPTQEEINRNRGRLHHANAYSQRHPQQQQQPYQQAYQPHNYSVEEESYLEASPDENTNSRNVRKGVVLSYSPSGEKNTRKPPSSRRPQLTSQRQTTSSRNQPQVYASRTVPNQAYQHVQSRVKDQVEQHKRMHKERQSQSRGAPVDSKEPQIYYKPAPSGPEAPPRSGNNAALRRRHSPEKAEDHHQPYIRQYQGVDSENLTHTDQHFSMRNTQGQWPSSIENALNISNNRSTGQNFYQGGTRQRQAHPHQDEATQGLIGSPIVSKYSESSPEQNRPSTSGGHHGYPQLNPYG